MAEPPRPPRNAFVRTVRRLYNPLHFTRGYNFVLFFIFAGALLGFSLSRLMFLNLDGIFCNRLRRGGAAPGECYFYSGEAGFRYRVGMLLHLAAVLPAGILVVLQFVPAIRHKMLLFHRVNGYVVILLSLASTAGVFMITEIAFGGCLALQAAVGLVSIIFVVALLLAYINIKRLQIEQHRAWMLRAWFYAGIIITVRIIMIASANIITSYGSFFEARSCADIDYIFFHFQNYTEMFYPSCAAYYTGQTEQHTVVQVNFDGDPVQVAAALGMSFTMSFWLAFVIHAVGIEVYLHLTPREAERLRNVSYQRQVEAGMKRPGDGGLTAQRLGDAQQWAPESTKEASSSK